MGWAAYFKLAPIAVIGHSVGWTLPYLALCALGAIVSVAYMARDRGGADTLLGLGVLSSFLVGSFSFLYCSLAATAGNFNVVEMSKIDALYFTVGTLSTAGTGLIAPVSDMARLSVVIQMILDVILIGWTVAVAVSRWGSRTSR